MKIREHPSKAEKILGKSQYAEGKVIHTSFPCTGRWFLSACIQPWPLHKESELEPCAEETNYWKGWVFGVIGEVSAYQVWGSCVNLRLVHVTKKEDIFSMTAHHCEGLDHGFLHIVIPATTGIDSQITTNAVNVLVEKLILKTNLHSSMTEVQTWQSAILYSEIH